MAIDIAPPKLKVAVVGGGPGGLATVIALSKVPNIEVVLYEKDKILREVGAGINIDQNTWNVLELLGVAQSLTTGHPTTTVLNFDGRNGEELSRRELNETGKRTRIRTQRTELQSALLQHVKPNFIHYGKKLSALHDLGSSGIRLDFTDGSSSTADLVVGADGIRSVVRDAPWPTYPLKYTGTTIWRALLSRDELRSLDPRFDITGWWHLPTSHVYFSPVSEGLSEIAAREHQDPEIHAASKSIWGVPVTNESVESHFSGYLPQVQEALRRIPDGAWREFAAFAGPELSSLTAWDDKIALVGDASHALSGAFGSGAGFAMEDGWVLAQSLAYFGNDLGKALPLFNKIRLPYYARMYAHLAEMSFKRAEKLRDLGTPSDGDKIKAKVIGDGGKDMKWMYENNIGKVWEETIRTLACEPIDSGVGSPVESLPT
ncbi:FAD/NAD(P)-binding domain-containing protein [Microthyrium microscopicum]|uniref:FAD/NAD(P)-binding domain-containing protein n=1 Tax=Microthyrium microscopicum TaxID=703497 RepID=A0A6A6U903_9PEZI|nr:FAD/NAD(P)-binding domain-containing protein [Microthyrium microscopicum]